jgi:sirohydrochlorin cobaltochelatase
MAAVLRKEHQGVFLGTLEGRPGLDDVMENVRGTDAREIMLVPFLLVAGVHAQKDLFGEGPGSWRHAFEKEGFIVKVNPECLIDIEEIIAILSDHTARAVEKIKS